MTIRAFPGICCLYFLAAFCVAAETPPAEETVWQRALALRAESFTLAPGGILYEQYHINKEGNRAGNETGRMKLVYDESGKAAVSIDWAKRGGRDFTAEREKRFDRFASRFTEYLSFTTPFDPDVQDKLERGPGKYVYLDGKTLLEYSFRLPVSGRRGFTGTARVDEDGRPFDFRYTLSPMPFILDIFDIHIVFDPADERIIFGSIEFHYAASFLFWDWEGGGQAGFDEWRRISVPPRLN